MGVLICEYCGRVTNTAVSDWWGNKNGKASKCHAAFVDGKWVKGCGYDTADYYTKLIVAKFLAGKHYDEPCCKGIK